jgi:hypothetical protein
MPAVSQAQQKLMGQAYALKKGELKPEDLNPEYKEQIEDLAKGMTLKQLEDYAKTSLKGLPKKIKEMKNLQTFENFINESLNENVYPDKNGQLSSYDKKTFTEVGRRTVYLGKDLAAIFLFGYSIHDWKGTNEYVVNVTCTTYSTDVKNLGNSSGSIIYSEAFGTENDALMAANDYLKNFKTK